jgi:hypothetical protein
MQARLGRWTALSYLQSLFVVLSMNLQIEIAVLCQD